MGRTRVLVVGQTPPPYGGQAVMVESIVRGPYRDIDIVHVRMHYSTSMSDVGKFQPKKLLHLGSLIVRVLWARLRTGARVLYYPPAGPDLVPALRDIAFLICTRWAFRTTVFHLHAGGISELYPRLPRPLQFLFRRAYFKPDLIIVSSEANPPDAVFLGARQTRTVPLGIPDAAATNGSGYGPDDRPALLYAGVIRESKGILVLLEACGALREQGLDFDVRLMGEFESPSFERDVWSTAARLEVGDRVTHLGVLTGADKDREFSKATVFCFPSYFESETFGVVLLEALQFGVPIVATDWRGIPSVVRDGETGYLVAVRDHQALADRVALILKDPSLRSRLGAAARRDYLDRFTEARFQQQLEDALLTAAAATSR